MKKRLVVGISGASCVCLAIQLLEEIRQFDHWETHLVMSNGARRTIQEETDCTADAVCELATKVYDIKDIGASIASGTFKVEGMVVVPCSMKTVAGIAHGYADNLLLRAADVNIKERRKLVLLARETPLSAIHLRNMTELVNVGAVVMPPMLTYYNKPQCMKDMNTHIIGKVLNEFGLELPKFKRWYSGSESTGKHVNGEPSGDPFDGLRIAEL